MAQADIILSSGRYLRDWAEGRGARNLTNKRPAFRRPANMARKQGCRPTGYCHNQWQSGFFNSAGIDLMAIGKLLLLQPHPQILNVLRSSRNNLYRFLLQDNKVLMVIYLKNALSELGYRTIYSAGRSENPSSPGNGTCPRPSLY